MFPVDFERADTVGLREKAIGLVKAGRAKGIPLDMIALVDNALLIWKSTEPEPIWPTTRNKRSLWLAYASYELFWRKLEKSLDLKVYTFVWWRDFPPSRTQLSFLVKAKKTGAHLICDLPTYPTYDEAKGIRGCFVRWHAARQRSVLAKSDLILSSSPHSEIEGTSTLYVSNGFDPSFVTPVLARKSGKLRLVGIGQWAYWHGLDRLFEGIHAADLQDDFEIELAGEGPEKQQLEALAKSLKIQVNWKPPIWGNERSLLLDDADAAIGTLAIHRKEVLRDRSLKHRLYGASGMPILLTNSDDEMAGAPLTLLVPVGDSPVDCLELKEKLLALRNESSRALAQREFSRRFSWKHTYENLWEFLLQVG